MERPAHIVSFNGKEVSAHIFTLRVTYHLASSVAGFKTCLSRMDSFVKGGFAAWMERHLADIVCLQEVKLSKKDVADAPRKVCANVEGWDSFWAFNDGSGGQRLGLNGVTTFVREGLTLSANAAPLGDPELDGEVISPVTASFIVAKKNRLLWPLSA